MRWQGQQAPKEGIVTPTSEWDRSMDSTLVLEQAKGVAEALCREPTRAQPRTRQRDSGGVARSYVCQAEIKKAGAHLRKTRLSPDGGGQPAAM